MRTTALSCLAVGSGCVALPCSRKLTYSHADENGQGAANVHGKNAQLLPAAPLQDNLAMLSCVVVSECVKQLKANGQMHG